MPRKLSGTRKIASITPEQHERLWDDLYLKEEGVILEFDASTGTGKLKSLADGSIYQIDNRELIRPMLELQPGFTVAFAPFESADGNDFTRVCKIITLR